MALRSMNQYCLVYLEKQKEWAADDDWIYQKVATKLALGTLADSDTPYVAAPIEDNRSVHNEADVAKIQTLQEQLDAQAAKIKTITDMLIGKGLV